MADKEIIKQWVALLEFKVGKEQAQDMVLNIKSIGTAITAVAAAFEAAAVGMAAALIKSAEGLKDTYYLAKNLGSSAADIYKFKYAIEASGGSFEALTASAKKFADMIRSNPSFRARLVQDFGLKLSDFYDEQTGQAKNALKNLNEYVKKLVATDDESRQKFGEGYQKKYYLGLIGMSFEEFEAMTAQDREFNKHLEEWTEKAKKAGVDVNKAVANGEKLAVAWEKIKVSLELIWLKFNQEMSPELTRQLEEFGKFLDNHAPQIAKGLEDIAKGLGDIFTGLKDGIIDFWHHNQPAISQVGKDLLFILDVVGKLTGATKRWEQALDLVLGYVIAKFVAGVLLQLGLIRAFLLSNPYVLIALGVSAAAVMAWQAAQAGTDNPNIPRDPQTGMPALTEDPEKLFREHHTDPDAAKKAPGGTEWWKDKWRGRPKWMGGTGGETQKGSTSAPGGAAAPGRDIGASSTGPTVDGQRIIGGSNLMSGGHYPGAAPGKDLTTITLDSGKKVTVHSAAAPSFRAFFNELEKSGYKINSIGGYNKRMKRGGSTWSEHAFGNAVDVNPSANPFHSSRTDLPDNVSAMAAKYGLSWGGDWKPGSRDPMHFEWRGVRPWEKPGQSALHRMREMAKDAPIIPDVGDTMGDRLGAQSPSLRPSGGSTSFNQQVEINMSGGDRGPATKDTDLAGPFTASKQHGNFQGRAE